MRLNMVIAVSVMSFFMAQNLKAEVPANVPGDVVYNAAAYSPRDRLLVERILAALETRDVVEARRGIDILMTRNQSLDSRFLQLQLCVRLQDWNNAEGIIGVLQGTAAADLFPTYYLEIGLVHAALGRLDEASATLAKASNEPSTEKAASRYLSQLEIAASAPPSSSSGKVGLSFGWDSNPGGSLRHTNEYASGETPLEDAAYFTPAPFLVLNARYDREADLALADLRFGAQFSSLDYVGELQQRYDNHQLALDSTMTWPAKRFVKVLLAGERIGPPPGTSYRRRVEVGAGQTFDGTAWHGRAILSGRYDQFGDLLHIWPEVEASIATNADDLRDEGCLLHTDAGRPIEWSSWCSANLSGFSGQAVGETWRSKGRFDVGGGLRVSGLRAADTLLRHIEVGAHQWLNLPLAVPVGLAIQESYQQFANTDFPWQVIQLRPAVNALLLSGKSPNITVGYAAQVEVVWGDSAQVGAWARHFIFAGVNYVW